MVVTDSYVRIGTIKVLTVTDAENLIESTRKRLGKDVCYYYQTRFLFDETGKVNLQNQPREQIYFGNPDTGIGKIVTAEEMLSVESPSQRLERGLLGLVNKILYVVVRDKIKPVPWLGMYERAIQN